MKTANVTVVGTGLCIAVLFLAGCTAAPIPLHKVVQNLESEVSKTHAISFSDLLAGKGSRQWLNAKKFVRHRQRLMDSSNPLFLVLMSLQLSVKGTISANGTLDLSPPAALLVSGSGINFGGKSKAESELCVPMKLLSLHGLPDEYLKEQMALINIKGLPYAIKCRLENRLNRNYKKLCRRIKQLESSFHLKITHHNGH